MKKWRKWVIVVGILSLLSTIFTGCKDKEVYAFESEIMPHVRKPLPHDALKIAYSPSSNGKSGVIGAGIMAWRKAEF